MSLLTGLTSVLHLVATRMGRFRGFFGVVLGLSGGLLISLSLKFDLSYAVAGIAGWMMTVAAIEITGSADKRKEHIESALNPVTV